jgi:hypothetical protein
VQSVEQLGRHPQAQRGNRGTQQESNHVEHSPGDGAWRRRLTCARW